MSGQLAGSHQGNRSGHQSLIVHGAGETFVQTLHQLYRSFGQRINERHVIHQFNAGILHGWEAKENVEETVASFQEELQRAMLTTQFLLGDTV